MATRRQRCVKCNDLTVSDWKLSYTEGKEQVKGIHCFRCVTKLKANRVDTRPEGMKVCIG